MAFIAPNGDLRKTTEAKDHWEWGAEFTPLYTAPPAAQRQWVGLTDDAKAVIDAARVAMNQSFEANDGEGSIMLSSEAAASLSLRLDEYDRAIEAAHGIKEKNT